MEYCGPHGIPHSQFLSWSVDDQAKALGWMAESRQRCSGCGTSAWEWDEDPEAYVAEPYICKGCARLEAGSERLKDAKNKGGMHMRLVRPTTD